MNDYSQYQSADRHASQRDRKRAKREQDARMRGNRSVFEMQKAQVKRDKRTIERKDNRGY
jgi:hypothetical protein